MNTLTQPYINDLRSEGYKVLSEGAGWAVVADPVMCMSGQRRWTEYEPVTLRSDSAACRFLIERS